MFAATVEQTSSGARNLRRHFLLTAALVATFAFSQSAFAAPINYGNFTGNTVDYNKVQEDSNSGDTPPLFGSPTVVGDSIDFNPVGFNANSANGSADITDGNLAFEVAAHSGFAISNINFAEAGDTTLAGNGTDATSTSVTANVFINVLEVDGAGINPFTIATQMDMNPLDGSYGLGTDGGGGPFFSTQWSGSLLVDIESELTARSIAFDLGATLISVNIDNTLSASSETGTAAFIAKKDFGGLSVTVNTPDPGQIPEPTSIALLALALCGFGLLGRGSRV